ncbi:MAG: thioester reductase domain-containing protein, partial [Vicinamibacteria bacterium]
LCSSRLGLAEEEFPELAETVDAIYPNAAAVNFLYPYGDLREVNVHGTRELLRLACRGRAKRFHFVSTLGVCYTASARELGEDRDLLPFLPDLPLGYAETKCVAEALVRAASERGLVASIYRLAPLTGSERTGRANEDDLLSRFVKGCVQMGAAPDLDVQLDDCPVDFASRALVALSEEPANGSLRVYHLKSDKPRHWRELVLWMNLFGYKVELEPYREWLSRLEEAASHPEHALHPLKPFFSRQVTSRNGETVFLPQAYEEGRRTRVRHEKTARRLARLGLTGFRSTPRYLERCFDSFVERAVLPQPSRPRPSGGSRTSAIPADRLASVLGRHLRDDSVTILDLGLTAAGVEESILTELTSWYTARETGLFRALVRFRTAEGRTRAMRLFLKVKPSDSEVMEIGRVVAELCSHRLGVLFDRFKQKLGFS